jgi:urease accessory protein
MSAVIYRSKPGESAQAILQSIRADGGVSVTLASATRGTVPRLISESGAYRVRFPRTAIGTEAVLINTGGGMTGGDRARFEFDLAENAAAVITTQAAERVYRSNGPSSEVSVRLKVACGARLDWLPQETILFSGARLAKRLDVNLATNASVLVAESLVFGRIARGERVVTGSLNDIWRVRRDNRLIFADHAQLEGPINRILMSRAVANGACAVAVVLLVSSDAEARLVQTRSILAEANSVTGASAWNGLLVCRLLSAEPEALRADLIALLKHLRSAPMPRIWGT